MKKFIAPGTVFLAICCMGLLVMLAAGTRWGTADAGMGVFFTFMCAVPAVVGVLMWQDANGG